MEQLKCDDRLRLVDPIEEFELLNSVAEEVIEADVTSTETQHIIDEMIRIAQGKDTEGAAQMVGLAAPQIGIGKRIIIIDLNATGMREQQSLMPIINPEIIEEGAELVDGREGCWSCGNFCANVPRRREVTVRGFTKEGQLTEWKFTNFTARILQHEVDHLNGIRCIDRVPPGEPWRLHLVDKNDKDEFNRYRVEWLHWDRHFPYEEWVRFRDGNRG